MSLTTITCGMQNLCIWLKLHCFPQTISRQRTTSPHHSGKYTCSPNHYLKPFSLMNYIHARQCIFVLLTFSFTSKFNVRIGIRPISNVELWYVFQIWSVTQLFSHTTLNILYMQNLQDGTTADDVKRRLPVLSNRTTVPDVSLGIVSFWPRQRQAGWWMSPPGKVCLHTHDRHTCITCPFTSKVLTRGSYHRNLTPGTPLGLLSLTTDHHNAASVLTLWQHIYIC